MAHPIADAPPTTLRPFNGPQDTVKEMIRACTGPRGERSTLVRSIKDHIIRWIAPKDYLSEMLAVRNYATEKCKYSNDALSVEQVQDPQRIAEQIIAHGQAVGDCFVHGTLVLTDEYELLPIQELRVGQKIWGLDKWVTVEGHTFKGTLPVDVIQLNNGSQVQLTPDHHVYVLECPRHGHQKRGLKTPCHCATSERHKQRVRVSELEEGMVLAMPDRIPFGNGEMDPDRAYVEGLFVSDGWSENSRFSISGQDGCQKEEQKREVERIAARLGIHTRWHRKYIAVNDSEWALRMQQMGDRARNKHLLSLNLEEAAAAATLRGVMADSGKNTNGNGRTFTTSSRQLLTQTRVLHKMLGISCSYRYIEDHGGLGENPIWRLGVRDQHRTDGRREKLLRVKSIDRAVFERSCWDIQTEDHHVYLPEHDVTVSNCDDVACFIAALTRQLGRETQFVIVGFGAKGHYSHVFTRAKEPKSGQWIVLDPVAGTDEDAMLQRVTTYQIWDIP